MALPERPWMKMRKTKRAVRAAVSEKLARLERGRLASECAKLDPKFEQALAEEGLGQELESWPE